MSANLLSEVHKCPYCGAPATTYCSKCGSWVCTKCFDPDYNRCVVHNQELIEEEFDFKGGMHYGR